MKIENTTMVVSQNSRPSLGAMTPATPYPTFARPTSHWNPPVGQPIDAATGAGMNRCPLPRAMPLTPTVR